MMVQMGKMVILDLEERGDLEVTLDLQDHLDQMVFKVI